MPKIISETVFKNEYNNISSFCHLNQEPIFVTKDGQGDLAIMSIEKYEEILDTAEFYKKICDGLNDLRNGRARPYSEFREEILNVWVSNFYFRSRPKRYKRN